MVTDYDKKIMEFDVREGYYAFINLFDDDEVDEIIDLMESEFNHDYSYTTWKEAKELAVFDYVIEWLVANIKAVTYKETEQLFKIFSIMFKE